MCRGFLKRTVRDLENRNRRGASYTCLVIMAYIHQSEVDAEDIVGANHPPFSSVTATGKYQGGRQVL